MMETISRRNFTTQMPFANGLFAGRNTQLRRCVQGVAPIVKHWLAEEEISRALAEQKQTD
ncbi:MAG: hypothetical protein U0X75_10750 [Acidobacteriota bacterium]